MLRNLLAQHWFFKKMPEAWQRYIDGDLVQPTPACQKVVENACSLFSLSF
jgi:hypothetical protein